MPKPHMSLAALLVVMDWTMVVASRTIREHVSALHQHGVNDVTLWWSMMSGMVLPEYVDGKWIAADPKKKGDCWAAGFSYVYPEKETTELQAFTSALKAPQADQQEMTSEWNPDQVLQFLMDAWAGEPAKTRETKDGLPKLQMYGESWIISPKKDLKYPLFQPMEDNNDILVFTASGGAPPLELTEDGMAYFLDQHAMPQIKAEAAPSYGFKDELDWEKFNNMSEGDQQAIRDARTKATETALRKLAEYRQTMKKMGVHILAPTAAPPTGQRVPVVYAFYDATGFDSLSKRSACLLKAETLLMEVQE